MKVRKMAKAKKETGVVKAPKSAGKPAPRQDYCIGSLTLEEEKDKYVATIELGKEIRQEDINFRFDEDSLEFVVSRAEKKEVKDEKKGSYFYESSAFSYYRKIPMPSGADHEKITTNLEEGLFHIYIPKKGAYQKPELEK
jgi:HSP20 family molecular chaperone IbpA